MIAFLIGALLIIASSTAVVLIVRNNMESKNNQIAAFLAQELIDNVQAISESDWGELYGLSPKGASFQYYASSTTRTLIQGNEILKVKGKNYTRYFSVEDVNRDMCGRGDITETASSTCSGGIGIEKDLSTQKITAFVNWAGNHSISIVQYLTRYHSNSVFHQTDWSGGAFPNEVVIFPDNRFSDSTSIDFTTIPGSISNTTFVGILKSSIFDTRTSGAAFNSIMFRGDLGDGAVEIYMAVSDSPAGPWSYTAYHDSSPLGWTTTMYPNKSYSIWSGVYDNKRYIRYRVSLYQNPVTLNNPRVDDIIINWSP